MSLLPLLLLFLLSFILDEDDNDDDDDDDDDDDFQIGFKRLTKAAAPPTACCSALNNIRKLDKNAAACNATRGQAGHGSERGMAARSCSATSHAWSHARASVEHVARVMSLCTHIMTVSHSRAGTWKEVCTVSISSRGYMKMSLQRSTAMHDIISAARKHSLRNSSALS